MPKYARCYQDSIARVDLRSYGRNYGRNDGKERTNWPSYIRSCATAEY